jgi:ATP-binding cassette subfamily E protein 1
VRVTEAEPNLAWQVKNLSGGELQRVAITLALGTAADIYLIDEPSAYLDSEQRIVAAKVKACAFRALCYMMLHDVMV